MKTIGLKQSLLDRISEKQHRILLATIRIYSVLSMKCKVVSDSVALKSLTNAELIDMYCDLFATYHEGAKKYFQEYSESIHCIAPEEDCKYDAKMRTLFSPTNNEVPSTYKILRSIRNHFNFHFSIERIDSMRSAPIGVVDEHGAVVFSSVLPNLMRLISDETQQEASFQSFQGFYRDVYDNEVKPFVEHLAARIHRVVDAEVYTLPE